MTLRQLGDGVSRLPMRRYKTLANVSEHLPGMPPGLPGSLGSGAEGWAMLQNGGDQFGLGAFVLLGAGHVQGREREALVHVRGELQPRVHRPRLR